MRRIAGFIASLFLAIPATAEPLPFSVHYDSAAYRQLDADPTRRAQTIRACMAGEGIAESASPQRCITAFFAGLMHEELPALTEAALAAVTPTQPQIFAFGFVDGLRHSEDYEQYYQTAPNTMLQDQTAACLEGRASSNKACLIAGALQSLVQWRFMQAVIRQRHIEDAEQQFWEADEVLERLYNDYIAQKDK